MSESIASQPVPKWIPPAVGFIAMTAFVFGQITSPEDHEMTVPPKATTSDHISYDVYAPTRC